MEWHAGVKGLIMQQLLEEVVQRAYGDQDVLAVLLFGSAARGEHHDDSDLDICLVLQPGTYQQSVPTDKRLEYLAVFPADVQVFQALPLYIRQRVLKEGRVLFCRDQDALYALAFRTVQAFTDFQPLYRLYLEEMTRAGP
jgi:predicted nucleotidyltransferase